VHPISDSVYADESRSILIDIHINSIDKFYNIPDPFPDKERELDEKTNIACV
jgi:hypothetical protein